MRKEISFSVEQMDDGRTWRATLSGDFRTIGYGENAWEAIEQVCDQCADEERGNKIIDDLDYESD
jgi:hypothetical protein